MHGIFRNPLPGPRASFPGTVLSLSGPDSGLGGRGGCAADVTSPLVSPASLPFPDSLVWHRASVSPEQQTPENWAVSGKPRVGQRDLSDSPRRQHTSEPLESAGGQPPSFAKN